MPRWLKGLSFLPTKYRYTCKNLFTEGSHPPVSGAVYTAACETQITTSKSENPTKINCNYIGKISTLAVTFRGDYFCFLTYLGYVCRGGGGLFKEITFVFWKIWGTYAGGGGFFVQRNYLCFLKDLGYVCRGGGIFCSSKMPPSDVWRLEKY